MPAYPNLTCKAPKCGKVFPAPRQRGQYPRTCSPECRAELAKHERIRGVRCDRCNKKYRRAHYSQRYCERCKDGCAVCGKPLPTKVTLPGKKRPRRYRPKYCSVVCQEAAWEHTELPLCYYCKGPVPLSKPPATLRDPGQAHAVCYAKAMRKTKAKEQGKYVPKTTEEIEEDEANA